MNRSKKKAKAPPPQRRSTVFKVKEPIHEDSVTCLAPIRCGLVLSGSVDKTIKLSNYETGEVIRTWHGHERDVTKLAYYDVPGKQYVLSGSRDTTLRIWHFDTPTQSSTLTGHDFVVSGVAVVDDGRVASGSRDNTIRLWDIESGECLTKAKLPRNLVTHIDWCRSTGVLAQTSEDKELKLWDIKTMQVICTFPQQQYIQTHCAISPDGSTCLSCSNGFNSHGCEVNVWDLRQRCLRSQMPGHEQSVNAAVFIPPMLTIAQNRQLVASASSDHTVKLWDLDSSRLIWTETVPTAGALLAMTAYGDGTVLIGGHHACLTHLTVASEAGRTFMSPQLLQLAN